MEILKLKIYQPQAHYRVPFSCSGIKLTYPIPPYSTVIGFLCNVCGVNDQDSDMYKIIRNLKISIAGNFECKNTEQIWFRNLNKESHMKHYGSFELREKNNQIGHVGGQSPTKVDVLEKVNLIIYLYSEYKSKNENVLSIIKNKLDSMEDRLQSVHLGRAEDWIVIKSIEMLPKDSLKVKRVSGNFNNFFWIPEKIVGSKELNHDLNNYGGIIYFLPTFSLIKNYENTFSNVGKRIYEKVKVKLNDGKFIDNQVLFDEKEKIPIFLGDFS